MICQNCKKREATIHITEIVNGYRREKHLCNMCGSHEKNFRMKDMFFQNAFNDFFHEDTVFERLWGNQSDYIPGSLACSSCGTTYANFKSDGLLGCQFCYSDFRDKLRNLFQQIGESHIHIGKKPVEEEVKVNTESLSELDKLEKQLKQCIAEEKYEEAAILRDKIKVLSKE